VTKDKKNRPRWLVRSTTLLMIPVLLLAIIPMQVFGNYNVGWVLSAGGSDTAQGVQADIIPYQTPTTPSGTFIASWIGIRSHTYPPLHWIQMGYYLGNPNISNCGSSASMTVYMEYNSSTRSCNTVTTVGVNEQHNYKLYNISGSGGAYTWYFYFDTNYQGSATVDFWQGATESILESNATTSTAKDLHANMYYYRSGSWASWPGRNVECTPPSEYYYNTTRYGTMFWNSHWLQNSTTTTCS
jgi:hypothetical protein